VSLVEDDGSTSEVVSHLPEERRRDQSFRRTDKGFTRLRNDEETWTEYEEETEELTGAVKVR